jgi:hypothetical protein
LSLRVAARSAATWQSSWIATARFALLAMTIVFELAPPAYTAGNKSSALGRSWALPFTQFRAATNLSAYENAQPRHAA